MYKNSIYNLMKKRIKFGSSRIQKLNRVAIPSSLLDNLNLKTSDGVEIMLDVEKEEIIIKKSNE